MWLEAVTTRRVCAYVVQEPLRHLCKSEQSQLSLPFTISFEATRQWLTYAISSSSMKTPLMRKPFETRCSLPRMAHSTANGFRRSLRVWNDFGKRQYGRSSQVCPYPTARVSTRSIGSCRQHRVYRSWSWLALRTKTFPRRLCGAERRTTC